MRRTLLLVFLLSVMVLAACVEPDPIIITATPVVTNTPGVLTPVVTQDVEASPTPEVITTPIPVTPVTPNPPPETGCIGTVAVAGLRVREEPSTAENVKVLTSLALNTRITVLEAKHVDVLGPNGELFYTNVWLRVRTPAQIEGWSAGFYGKEYFIVLELTEACSDMEFGTTSQDFPRYGVGWTFAIGAKYNDLCLAGPILRQKGYDTRTTVAAETNSVAALLACGWHVNLRPFYDIGATDCGEKLNVPAGAAAWDRVNKLAPHVDYLLDVWGVRGTGKVVIQIENECWFPDAVYARDWLIAASAACTSKGWECIPQVFGTGNPDVKWLPTLVPAFKAITSQGHWYGMNVGPYQPELKLCDQTHPITPYTTWYGEMVREYAPDTMKVWVTESAPGDARQAVEIEDYMCFLPRAHRTYNVVNFWYTAGFTLGDWEKSRWTSEQIRDFAAEVSAIPGRYWPGINYLTAE